MNDRLKSTMKYAGVFLLGLFVGAFLIESLEIYRDLMTKAHLKTEQENSAARADRNNQSETTTRQVSPAPLPIERFNMLFLGQTPNCNADIVTNHRGHLNCVNTPIGYTIKEGHAAQQHLFLGVVPNRPLKKWPQAKNILLIG